MAGFEVSLNGRNWVSTEAEHLRRTHPGGESNALSDCDQNGVPIGNSRCLATDFARPISAIRTTTTSGA